ncbi:MAG: hypothetical protein J5588_04910 [Bacteroidales bacterium]|nr:hypothetical protein [Bacteroidales bacterium]
MVRLLMNSSNPMDTLKYFQTINDKIDAVKYIVDVSNATIANEISAINTMLVAFTIVFGIVGVFIGVYISCLQRKVSKMSDNIENKEHTIVKLAQIVEDTDNKIQSDIEGLYAKLRKEETKALLCRLEEEPLDIGNISELLLARQLDDDGFPILKRAYLKLIENEYSENKNSANKHRYLLLFFQHYLYFAIKDDDMRKDIISDFEYCMKCAFKRDIIKSTKDFCMVLSESDVPFEREQVLVDYLKAINRSEFKGQIELKNIFQDEIKNNSLLANAIEKCTSDKIYLEMFGVKDPNSNIVNTFQGIRD